MPRFDYQCESPGCQMNQTPIELLVDTSDSEQLCEVCKLPMTKLVSGSFSVRYGCGGFHNTDYKCGN